MQADRIDKALRMHIPIMTMSASDEVTDNLVGARAERCVTPLAARSWMGYDPGMPEPGAAKGWLLIIIARDNVDFNTRSAACYLNLKTGQFKAEKWTPKEFWLCDWSADREPPWLTTAWHKGGWRSCSRTKPAKAGCLSPVHGAWLMSPTIDRRALWCKQVGKATMKDQAGCAQMFEGPEFSDFGKAPSCGRFLLVFSKKKSNMKIRLNLLT